MKLRLKKVDLKVVVCIFCALNLSGEGNDKIHYVYLYSQLYIYDLANYKIYIGLLRSEVWSKNNCNNNIFYLGKNKFIRQNSLFWLPKTERNIKIGTLDSFRKQNNGRKK